MEPSTNVSGGEFRLHGEPQANDAGHARARHAGAGHGDPQIVGAGKSFRGDHIRAWRRNVRLETSIARGALAAADVDEAANFVEIGDGDDAITAGKGAHRGAVDIRLVGEKRTESATAPWVPVVRSLAGRHVRSRHGSCRRALPCRGYE